MGFTVSATGSLDLLLVTIENLGFTVSTVGLTVNAAVQQEGQTDCWSL